jgi:hypothetical protein
MPDPVLVFEDNNPPQHESEPAQEPKQQPKKSIPIEDKSVKVQRQGSYHSGCAKDSCCYSSELPEETAEQRKSN